VARALVGRRTELARLHRIVGAAAAGHGGTAAPCRTPAPADGRRFAVAHAKPEFFGVLPDGFYATPRLELPPPA
jgi:hypothetical protein